ACTMSSTCTSYDLSTSTFSPDGTIFQVEYATNAVETGKSYLEKIILQPRVVTCVYAYTHYGATRPLGCSFMLRSYSANDSTEFCGADPSGISYDY
ncbi:hypothetical protein U0070_005139, partial [Myodes glareolus]